MVNIMAEQLQFILMSSAPQHDDTSHCFRNNMSIESELAAANRTSAVDPTFNELFKEGRSNNMMNVRSVVRHLKNCRRKVRQPPAVNQ